MTAMKSAVVHNSRAQKKVCVKRPWSVDETEAVQTFFRSHITKSMVPGKKLCEECKEKYDVLNNRKWQDVKYHVKNLIASIKKRT